MQPDLSRLNARLTGDAEGALKVTLSGALGRIAMVSSFGADSAVLLHMVAQIDRATPVLFIDTLMLFEETLAYQHTLAQHLGLENLQVIQPNRAALFARDTDAVLHRSDTDSCCALRKTRPLEQALQGYDGWITGRKRFQGGARTAIELFEYDATFGHLKVNPLAGWGAQQLGAYMDTHALPRHPLVSRGYPSIGCAPCTSPVAAGEDPRAGRWRGTNKDECGIHIVDGRVIRRQAS
ncbi:MAG: phosphoadenylyl-sulfate reductase [Pararhodobacter sp.]